MRKRGLKWLAVCMALAVTVSGAGVGGFAGTLQVSAKQVSKLSKKAAESPKFENQTSNEVVLGLLRTGKAATALSRFLLQEMAKKLQPVLSFALP